MRNIRNAFVASAVSVLLLGALARPVAASTISQNLLGTQTSSLGFWGQSVVTPGGAGWNGLSFNFYAVGGGAQAFGTIFLLSQQYLGTPNALSTATPGYVAQATAAGSAYTFAQFVALQPNTTYWFYTNGSQAGVLVGNTPSGVSGEGHYFSGAAGSNFSGPFNGVNFTLQGNVIPEPATLLLVGTGLAAAAVRRRRMKKQS